MVALLEAVSCCPGEACGGCGVTEVGGVVSAAEAVTITDTPAPPLGPTLLLLSAPTLLSGGEGTGVQGSEVWGAVEDSVWKGLQ